MILRANRQIDPVLVCYWSVIETTWGHVGVAGTDDGFIYAGFPESTELDAISSMHANVGRLGIRDSAYFADLSIAVRMYFAGQAIDWGQFPVCLVGTSFQRGVWEATRSIAYGMTVTYGEIAAMAGLPRAARAAGSALAANPAGLLVPCHRVVAANGLGGFGSRLDRKQALLRLERPSVEPKGDRD